MPELKCISTVPRDGTLVALVRQRLDGSRQVALMEYQGPGLLSWRSHDHSHWWADGIACGWIEPEAFSHGLLPGSLFGTTMEAH